MFTCFICGTQIKANKIHLVCDCDYVPIIQQNSNLFYVTPYYKNGILYLNIGKMENDNYKNGFYILESDNNTINLDKLESFFKNLLFI